MGVGLALLARWEMDKLWQDRLPFGTFFLAVIVISQFTSVGPSIFATIAGFLLGAWFFVAPRHTLMIADPLYQFNAFCYFVVCALVLFFSHRVRHALVRERSARMTLSKLTAIIESSDDAIVGKSLDNKITSWNRGARKLYGYEEAEMVGKSADVLLPPDRLTEPQDLIKRVGKGESVNHFETTRLRKDGQLVDVALCVSPILDARGKVVGVSTIARDITERKRAEQERERLVKELRQEVAERKEAQRALQETQEITLRQERLAAVGRLAAGLAHEFNNILTIIQGHAALLLDNPNMDEDSVKSITHISEGVERTANLVKQMLAFSRKQVMQQCPVRLQDTMSQIADMLGRLLGASVKLSLEIAPNLPAILADPEMLQQIIVNLVVNARDAMVDGGQLTIRASEVTYGPPDLAGKPERRAGHFVQLSVIDTGSGIDSATIAHLFEPFFTTKEVGKGTGLGLATVHGMVNQNAGWIEVESTVGKGTTFNIFFPLAEVAPEKRGPARTPGLKRGRGETILVVEDETVLRELVQDILQAQGYRVLTAATGREALAVWAEHGEEINLVLTDMSMPDGMSGQDLATKLQEQSPHLPVIFSSGYSQEMLAQRQGANSDTTFLSKPYHPAELAKVVRAELDAASRNGTTAAPKASPLVP